VVKVVDFGLVKEFDQEIGITIAGRIAGTPHYLSPEAISSPERVGPPSDMYALGCVGYFLITGHPVFEGKTAVEICGHHLNALPVLPGERLGAPVPEMLSALVMSCLQKAPERRPSARSLIALLDGDLGLERWTAELARVWWQRQRPEVIETMRHQRQPPVGPQPEGRPDLAAAGSSTTRAFAAGSQA
jgi:serine/threonine-protein kinase